MSESEGRCACGAVVFSLQAPPKFSYLCQCRQCQKATGSGHAALTMVLTDDLKMSGPISTFDQAADSGNTISRGFCSRCGTPMILTSSGYPNLAVVPAGAFDDPSTFSPTQVLWHAHAQDWDIIDSRLTVNEQGVPPS